MLWKKGGAAASIGGVEISHERAPMQRPQLSTGTSVAVRPATRSSFLERLKNWADQESWRQFLTDYGRVIHASAIRAGLRAEDAQDVVQDTLLSVARSIPGFVYDRSKGSFEAWVCRIARMRVIDHLRRRRRDPCADAFQSPQLDGGDWLARGTGESSESPFEVHWDEVWREHLLLAGMERLKRSTSPSHFQILHMSVIDRMDEAEIARVLGISRAQVYLVRHRLGRKLRRAIDAFRTDAPPGP